MSDSRSDKKVLIGVPVKNCARFLRQFVRQLIRQDYPRDLLTVVFLENDSDDNTLAAASDAVKVLNTVVIKAVLGRHDFGFKLPHTQDRHKPEFQRRRLHVLSMLRQMIVDRYLGDNDYVFWLDADFESIPQDAISRLVGLDLDMVIPLYTLGNGFMFDGSSYRTGPGGQIEGIKDLVERYPVQDLFEMDSINAAALVHRRVFAKVGYDPNDPDQEGPHLARAAIRAGMKAWFYKGVTIIHANV